ncbi:hypothetical protein M0R45_010531 [Rubus argutus]|uniref:START domain-containing protein n=1 Tax=Rubus argutus TaxID=59490 RepID=A0AAW1YAP2_RUBAR
MYTVIEQSSNGFEQPKEEVPKFLQLQESYNICMAAYREIMTMAMKANTWVVDIPPLGSIEELQKMFRTPPSPGMEIEYSIESGIVTFKPEHLVSTMIDVDEWASALCNIVHHKTAEVPSGIMANLMNREAPHTRDNFRGVKMINAELLSPMPCVTTRKFSFVRFVRQIIQDIWAVVDVSTDYFPNTDSTLKVNCKRRPSGVIIRRRDDCSEVIWIENMEVQKCNVQDSIYSGVINSNLAFGAKRWISTLSTKEKRLESRFATFRMPTNFQGSSVRAALLKLTRRLKKVYLNYITKHPDETKLDLLSDKGVKILKDTDALGNDNCMAVYSFRVEATPLSVFNFLVKRNQELQWPNLQELEEPEEVIKLVTDDDSNCITLHTKSVIQPEARENYKYLLQEASRDEFCSFIISSPITHSEVNSALGLFGKACCAFRPFGFSIIPDGSRGLQSDASLVTIALPQVLDADRESDEVIEIMSNLVSSIVGAIKEAVTVGEEAIEL